MIKLVDTIILSGAKLRAHKLRTIITILLASLLFGILIAASLIKTGVFESIGAFRQGGLTSRYIVNVNNAMNDTSVLSRTLRDPVLLAKAKTQYANLVQQKTDEAKRLGITYTQASDQPPYSIGADGSERLTPNDSNGIVYGLLREKFASETAFDDAKLQSIAKRYHATNFFATTNNTVANGSTLSVLPGGKEVFYDETDEAEQNQHYQAPIVDGMQMTLAPSELSDSLLLPGNAGWKPDDGTLPITLPQNRIERLLGLESLPEKATTEQKTERLRVVRDKSASLAFKACYRNSASKALIQQVIAQQKEIKANQGKKGYQMPSRIYTLPEPTSCAEPTIATDTRTVDEKKEDDNQALFDAKFGNGEEPKSYFVAFKVVGVSPAESTQSNDPTAQSNDTISSMNDVIDTLLATNGIGQVIPESLFNQIKDKNAYADLLTYTPTYFFGNEDNMQRYVEFSNATDAQKFIDEQSCKTQADSTCKPAGRLYQASLAFSNSAALDDIKAKASQLFTHLTLGVTVLAVIILWIAIGRTVADGRHETAVFRAIGFKRIDITAIYLLYTVILTILVALCAMGIGLLGAYIVNEQFATSLTAQAQYAFGDVALTKHVSLIGVNGQEVGLLLFVCLGSGVLSATLPLLRNVRRSPIRDMREE